MKKIGIGLLLVIGIFLGYVSTRPDSFRVERKIEINAPAEKVFPFINNFKNWKSWSPWDKLDPSMKTTYSGAEEGKGAVYEWKGNSEVGSGRMEITESVSPSKIVIDLRFIEPFEDRSTTEFYLEGKDQLTVVTWAMSGNYNFMSKIMCIFVSMDGMLGKDFEAGLKNMKESAEK